MSDLRERCRPLYFQLPLKILLNLKKTSKVIECQRGKFIALIPAEIFVAIYSIFHSNVFFILTYEFFKIYTILRKTIEGYLDSVLSLTFNTIKTLLIMHAFHSSRHLQSKWMLYFSHASLI